MLKINDHRYSLTKPSISTFNDNKDWLIKIISDWENKESSYALTDKIIKDLMLVNNYWLVYFLYECVIINFLIFLINDIF